MDLYRILKIITGLVCLSIAIFLLDRYIIFTQIIQTGEPITYRYIDNSVHRGGRGEYYQIEILCKGRRENIDITSKDYNNINKNIYPKLFYSKSNNIVFSEWTVLRNMRIAIMLIVFSIFLFIPFNRIFKKVNESLKK